MIRALIVDDEAPARRKLARLLAAAEDVTVAGEAKDGVAAVEAIRRLRPDLVFLDIRMPGLDGFGVIEALGAAAMPMVVFVTAYDDYALKAFDVHALDYVLKPVSPRRFELALERVRQRLQRPPNDALARRLEALLRQADPSRYLERLLVEQDGRGVLLSVAEIDRVEAQRNYVRLHARSGCYVVRRTIGALAERLDPARFLRLSRSEIVRLDAVKEFQDWFHGDRKVILKDGTELLWSRRYRARQKPDFTLE